MEVNFSALLGNNYRTTNQSIDRPKDMRGLREITLSIKTKVSRLYVTWNMGKASASRTGCFITCLSFFLPSGSSMVCADVEIVRTVSSSTEYYNGSSVLVPSLVLQIWVDMEQGGGGVGWWKAFSRLILTFDEKSRQKWANCYVSTDGHRRCQLDRFASNYLKRPPVNYSQLILWVIISNPTITISNTQYYFTNIRSRVWWRRGGYNRQLKKGWGKRKKCKRIRCPPTPSSALFISCQRNYAKFWWERWRKSER